jgi:hypothetical protein
MSRTQISSKQITDYDLSREDMNIDRPGDAVLVQVVAGSGIEIESTGADPGTGVVTLKTSSFIFSQDVPSDTWSITHNLLKFPAVTVVDSSGRVVVGGVTYTDNNNIVIDFNGAFSGKVYLN